MKINEFLELFSRRQIYPYQMKSLYPAIKMKSGLEMSVQASRTHYCTPRSDFGPYDRVEVGFPNRVVGELLIYQELPPKVYSYLPAFMANSLAGIIYKISNWLMRFPEVRTRIFYSMGSNPLMAVYPHVPVNVIDKIVEKNGGITHIVLGHGERQMWQTLEEALKEMS
jgi:hypothetical protein